MEIFTATKIYLRRDLEKDLWLDIMNDIYKIVLFQSANRNIEVFKNDRKNIKIKKINSVDLLPIDKSFQRQHSSI